MYKSILSGLNLLSRREKFQLIGITVGLIIIGLFEVFTIGTALVFANTILQPDELLTNEYMAYINNLLQLTGPSQLILLSGILVLVLLLVTTLSNVTIVYLRNRFTHSIRTRVAMEMMEACIHAPYEWYLTRNSSMLLRTVTGDSQTWASKFVQPIIVIVNQIIKVITSMVIVVALTPWLGLVSIFAAIALGYAALRITRPSMSKAAAEKIQARNRTFMAANHTFVGIKDIKLSSRESFFSDFFTNNAILESDLTARLTTLSQVPSQIMIWLGQSAMIAIILALWFVGFESGEIATVLALLLLVAMRVVPLVSGLSNSFTKLLDVFPHIDYIYELFESTANSRVQLAVAGENDGYVIEDWHTVELDNVGLQYPNSYQWAVQNVYLKLPRDRVYGIAGPSGAGKSTLVDLILGLIQPTEGEMRIDNRPLKSIAIKSWQKRVGYVPQAPFIADDSVRANIAFGVPREKVDDAWVMECLRMANLEDLVSELENGLDTFLGDRGLRLSGGQRQRLTIARALYNRPELLVFDEATSSLDTISEEKVMTAINGLRAHLTIIIIAHRLTTLRICDQIFLLDDGNLVAQGTFAVLKAEHDLFRRMAAGVVIEEEVPF